MAQLREHVGRGGCCVCERGGRPVCFGGLAAAGLLGNLSQLLAGAVWACLGSGSLRHGHIPSSRPAGTRGPRVRLEGGGQGGSGPHEGTGMGLWGRLRGGERSGWSQEDP